MRARRSIAGSVVLALAGIVGAVPASSRDNPSVTQLGWLAGCLEMRSGDRLVEEQRMSVRAGSMLGMARTTSAKGLGEFELTLIHEKDGKIVFEARPSGQPTATFTATVAGPDSVVFAAPGHDYPQIVGYRRAGADSVVAWIDGKTGGKSRRVEFPYRRVGCPGPPN
ncbi:MAG: hypothetical protein K0S19_127 [Geminicoccaceae bacterium]|nr:hypothetical protein [Geminicoccaceae bacterium]